jgi:NAD(P)H-dependent FMN reductase/ketosteroid isomerase-like protein
MSAKRVAVIVGSLRRDSLSRKLALGAIECARGRLECRLVEIGDLPLYNEDLESTEPAPWRRFRAEVSGAHAVLFVTPEYNRSIPGVLKNAVDVGSRPPGDSVFKGKPAGVISQTPHKLGAFGANQALRQTFVFLDMPVLQQPEVYIGGCADLLDAAGHLHSADTVKLINSFIDAFVAWIDKVAERAPGADFSAFMQRREEIARAYVNGDAAPLQDVVTREDPATFFPPNGAAQRGADAVARAYVSDAQHFAPGGESRLDVMHSEAGRLAFWSGTQIATVRTPGKDAVESLQVRVTEVFRLEEGDWKLIHRHADIPAAPQAGISSGVTRSGEDARSRRRPSH